MNSIVIFLILLFSCSFITAETSLRVSFPIKNLMEGEIAQVHILSEGEPATGYQRQIQGNGFLLEYFTTAEFVENGESTFAHSYYIRPFRTGNFRIPSIEFKTKNGTVKSPSAQFTVHPKSRFKKEVFTLDGRTIPYYSAIFLDDKQAYINETIATEIRFIIPESMRRSEWGIADATQAKELIAWKPKPPFYGGRFNAYKLSDSEVSINGVPHIGSSYKTSIHSNKAGRYKYGPVSVSAVLQKVKQLEFGLVSQSYRQNLTASPITIQVIPLPPSTNAKSSSNVGAFQIRTTLPDKRRITLQDSIKITLDIHGEGNFLTLAPPILKNGDDWELIETIKSDPKQDQRSIDNQISYDLILSPKSPVTKTPEISFSFFNPQMEQYQELVSETASLTIVENALLSGVLDSPPIENQKDILGFIEVNDTSFISKLKIPRYWHVLPAFILLSIVGIWLKNKYKAKLIEKGDKIALKQELKDLANSDLSYSDFLKRAGTIIERSGENSNSPELQQILTDRDSIAFSPNSQDQAFPSNTKAKILKALAQLSILLFLGFLSQDIKAQPLPNATEAIQSEDYLSAIKEYLSIENRSADINYNIAVCYYKLNKPGLACLYFHRAVSQTEGHPEASQNLKFLSQKLMHPSLPIEQKFDKYVGIFNKSTYSQLIQISLWVIIIFSTALMLLRHNRRRKLFLVISISVGLIVAIISFVAYQAYPKSLYFAPVESLAVVTDKKQVLLTAPVTPLSPNSDIIITEIAEGSLCQIINHKADWHYIELPSATRGWINSSAIEKILGQDPSLLESPLP